MHDIVIPGPDGNADDGWKEPTGDRASTFYKPTELDERNS